MSDTAPPPAMDEALWPEPRTRKRRVDAEHCFQKHGKMFALQAIACGYEFLAFDRHAPYGRFSHMKQKAAGAVKGCADTLTIADGKHIWVEWKAPGKKPDEDQRAFGERVKALGDIWDYADSVVGYYSILATAGVPLRERAGLMALDHQARAEGEIERAQLRAGRVPRRMRPAAPTAAAVRRARKAGVLV